LKVTTVLLGQASLVRRVHRPFIRRDPDRAVASRASQPGYTGVHEASAPSLGMHREDWRVLAVYRRRWCVDPFCCRL